MSSTTLAATAAPATLFAAPIDPACRASIVVPARDEEDALPATLDALRRQVDLDGSPLPYAQYEVLLLLNNCTDSSHALAERYRQAHPCFHLHLAEQFYPPDRAHVGTARRTLMDEACTRLESIAAHPTAILSTDADTLIAPDWVARNLAHIEAGAEAVGGVIHLFLADLVALDPYTRRAYQRDRRFQALVAELESLLDPDPADPSPRHLQHFGASMACTPEIYRRAGGLPPVKPLEDVAFVDALRRVGARLRHAPDVHIHTSARLDGRAEIGLSGQLRHWREEGERNLPHIVQSAEWMAHRFVTLAALRAFNTAATSTLAPFPEAWHERLTTIQAEQHPTPRFLELLDADRLIEETFPGPARHAEIVEVCEAVEHLLAAARRP